ncbi:MAG: hypothetical protein P4L26_07755 [Terracidiphilus sp.]|nr:hypothetical protein [Terracidiphilus sp.]
MKTELVIFGMRFGMATRARRRLLVMMFYGVFGGLLLVSWLRGSHTGGGFLTIEFTLLVGPILGGYFTRIGVLAQGRGLVELFEPRKVLKYPDSATILRPSTLLRPVEDHDPELRADERSVRRRDHAHYVSQRFIGGVVSAAFLLEFSINSHAPGEPGIFGMPDVPAARIVYCLLQIGYIAVMTLPQAILLWSEPDMEDPQ